MQIPSATDPLMSGASLKIPPAWDPSWETRYSFRQWHRDILLWAAATDVPTQAQAAAICMRLGGAAKELTKELDMNIIQNGMVVDLGDGNGPVQLNGVAVVLRGLSKRFAPADGEQSVRALANVMSFQVLPNESIDEVLSRFEVVLSRASDEANFDAQPQAKAWMLLTGLRLPPEEWMHLLHPLNGRLPNTEAEFGQLMQFVRRRGRVHQHGSIALAAQQARGGARTHTYVTNAGDEAVMATGHGYLGLSSNWGGSASASIGADPVWSTDPWAPTQTEQVWYEDDGEGSSSATDEESEMLDLKAYLAGVPEQLHGDVLWQEYLAAKHRWRQFTGKNTRAVRRFHRKEKGKGKHASGKSKGKGKNGYMNNVFVEAASSEPEHAYMRAKGKAKGNQKRNPRGADGNIMKCHNCGSEEHLVRDCPRGQSAPTRAFLALPPCPVETDDEMDDVYTGAYHLAEPRDVNSRAYHLAEPRDVNSRAYHLAELRDVNIGAYHLEEPRDVNIGAYHLEEPRDVNTGAYHLAESRAVFLGSSAPAAHAGRSTSRVEHMKEIALATSEYYSKRSSASTAQWFFPTYERASSNREPIAAWHAKTTLRDGREGLLVDVGAHDNLCGEQWVKRVERNLSHGALTVRYEDMKKPLSVEGVGNGAQVCRQKVVVPLVLPDGEPGTYEAPVIADSGVPGLLGLKALVRNKAVIDCANMKLYFIGPGDAKIVLPPGSKEYDLEQAESGHMLLPISSTTSAATCASSSGPAVALHLAHAGARVPFRK
eukprot:5797397-Amphidinium_carterae.1